MLAARLLKRKGVSYTNIDVSFDYRKRAHMTELAGGVSSVPQIFIDGKHIGGCDQLHALERRGKLDALLAGGEP
jgi:glutaredoxin 3